MVLAAILVVLVSGQALPDSGFLTVESDMPGLAVYLEGDYIGRTPIMKKKVETGSFTVTVVSNDSLDLLYDGLRKGRVNQRLNSAWSLIGVDAGTHRVRILRGEVTKVFIDYGRVLSAPREAKTCACLGVGGVFGIGAIIGLIIGLLIN
ncbi:MAG: PEGA domain-containing protein [candidate division WOR-3 bacterium]|nr:MAG: PEGA domain-containing protein [candidate division WOR-3 bacterium]